MAKGVNDGRPAWGAPRWLQTRRDRRRAGVHSTIPVQPLGVKGGQWRHHLRKVNEAHLNTVIHLALGVDAVVDEQKRAVRWAVTGSGGPRAQGETAAAGKDKGAEQSQPTAAAPVAPGVKAEARQASERLLQLL